MSNWDPESVIQSIETLYSTGDPDKVKVIQSSLQKLQKSPDGLRLAQMLLSQPSRNCQFFGALTYTVVINNGELSKSDVIPFVKLQIQHLLHQTQQEGLLGPGLFITRKLLSNISLLFINYSDVFSCPLACLLLALSGAADKEFEAFLGESSSTDPSSQKAIDTGMIRHLLSSLSLQQLSILILFSTIVVEDICKIESSSSIHESVISGQTFQITEQIFEYLDSTGNPVETRLDLTGLECLMSWVTYTSLAEDNSTIRYSDRSKVLIDFLLRHLDLSIDAEVIHKAVLVATEIVEINPRLLNHDSRNLLKLTIFGQGQFGPAYIQKLSVGHQEGQVEEEESLLAMVNLIITLLSHDILHLAKTLTSDESQLVLKMLIQLSNFPGVPIEDEQLSDLILSFWEDLANVFIDDEDVFDNLFEAEEKLEFNIARNSLFQQVCSVYWKKIHFPQNERVFQSIRSEFLHYRSNVADLFIVTYSLLKEPFFQLLAENIYNEIKNRQLVDLESSLYLLCKVTEDSAYLESQSLILLRHIEPIFNEYGLISMLSNSDLPKGSFLYPTTINFLSSITFYFKSEAGTSSLGDVFDFLFRILLSGDIQLSLHCSKTILKICQECREKLLAFLPNLETFLVEMLRNKDVDNLIRQRMTNSYTSIGRCVRSEPRFAEILRGELTELKSIIDQQKTISSSDENFGDYLTSLLTCVVEIGKASQIPEEAEDFYNTEQQQQVLKYWEEDPLGIQALVLDIVKDFSLDATKSFPYSSGLLSDSLVTEKCCLILKSGLGEAIKGPFVFPLFTILDYIVMKISACTSSAKGASSVTHLYSLLESVIIVNPPQLTSEVVGQILQSAFASHLGYFMVDPDLIHSSLSLFSTILEKKPSLIVHINPLFSSTIVEFALAGLRAKEPLVIKVASKFWLTLLALKRGTLEDQSTIAQLMTSTPTGQIFVHTLLQSFIDTSRSNLESYYQVFRNLITKYPTHFKKWMLSSFEQINIDNEAPSNGEEVHKKRKVIEKNVSDNLVNKLVVSRGSRTVNTILKSFWLEANGLIEFNTRSY